MRPRVEEQPCTQMVGFVLVAMDRQVNVIVMIPAETSMCVPVYNT